VEGRAGHFCVALSLFFQLFLSYLLPSFSLRSDWADQRRGESEEGRKEKKRRKKNRAGVSWKQRGKRRVKKGKKKIE